MYVSNVSGCVAIEYMEQSVSATYPWLIRQEFKPTLLTESDTLSRIIELPGIVMPVLINPHFP